MKPTFVINDEKNEKTLFAVSDAGIPACFFVVTIVFLL